MRKTEKGEGPERTRSSPFPVFAVVLGVLLPACTTHELIVPGTYRIRGVYEVQVPTAWNRVPDFKEIWTMDGLPLQSLTFFPPLAGGRSIAGRRNKRQDIAPPVFRRGMNGRLHVALYRGTRVGFYDRHLADARAVMESLHILGNRKNTGKGNATNDDAGDNDMFMDWESILERLGEI
ncbi:MAG: hypothetical protein FD149_2483 [Rhodospirillaceae bacterium]|nr:MAG: hypothetical protein FD149_2483 [Rhodospirillaceae bacterium]